MAFSEGSNMKTLRIVIACGVVVGLSVAAVLANHAYGPRPLQYVGLAATLGTLAFIVWCGIASRPRTYATAWSCVPEDQGEPTGRYGLPDSQSREVEGWVQWVDEIPARRVEAQQNDGTACLDCGCKLEPGIPRRCDDCEADVIAEAEAAEAYDQAAPEVRDQAVTEAVRRHV